MRAASALLLALCVSLVIGLGERTSIAQAPKSGADFHGGSRRETGDVLPLVPSRHLRFDESHGTWMSLDISPDGKSILFELLGDLYEMSIEGGEARCIACGMPFDSQGVFSPDGKSIAFISDRSGNENLWIAHADGSEPRALSTLDDNTVFISPAWSADGKSIYVSRFKPDINAFELWQYGLDGASPTQITHAKYSPDTPKESRGNALGAAVSADGHYLYYEAKTGLGFDDEVTFPLWHIVRRDLKSGQEITAVNAEGSAFRPGLAPNGKCLVYATRYHGQTGLRIRNLENDQDRWLIYPVQRDDQEASASRDLIPRYAFTPDGRAILLNYGGLLHRIDLDSRQAVTIPFVVHVDLPMGPAYPQDIREDTGSVRARLLQTPVQSPDGKRITFSALGHVYIASLADRTPHRLTRSDDPEFNPSWSPDGESIVYITWTAKGGDIWTCKSDGGGEPKKITEFSDFYTNPVYSPDGKSIFAQRTSNYEHNHRHMEFAPYQSDAIEISVDGGKARVVATGVMGNIPQFTQAPGKVYLNYRDGLYEISLADGSRRRVLNVTGPTWYFVDGTAPADAIKMSPDGHWALAQITQELYLLEIPQDGKELSIVLNQANSAETRLTSVGADFFDWADDGKTITWAVGSTFFRQSLASVATGHVEPPQLPDRQRAGVEAFDIAVEVARDTPRGALVLRGGTAITMRGDEVISDSEVVIVDNRIVAVGRRGTVAIPAGAAVRDVSDKFLLPGFTDVHLHWADVRRGVLDLQSPGFLATLAYGVTTGLDPSPLSIDMLAYQDLLDAGEMTGSRVFSTGPAVFSFNDLRSEQQTLNVLRRYSEFYRIRNLKEYRTGNRRQREWMAKAGRALNLHTTTEGALDMKLDMTQIQDGFPGNEHAFSAVPLGDDIVQLFARSGVSYTPTLQIGNGGPAGQNFFYDKASPVDDAKLNHFEPGFFLDHKMERLHWALLREYDFPLVAQGAAAIQRAGGIVAVGSHGELPGLGFHLEMQALASGGMTPMEVLLAATIGSSRAIGRAAEFGSLEPGKFADLLILTKDPLVDIKNTLSIESVMKNGRLYDASTLDEEWPRQRPLKPLWFWEGESPDSRK
jgi:Tol biopolymer transport system component